MKKLDGLVELLTYSPHPRPWQEVALARWSIDRRGVFSVVTGAGKTVFAFMCFREFVREMPNARILVIVPTVALLDQWCAALVREVGLPSTAVAIVGKDIEIMNSARVFVSVINTARSNVKRITQEGEWLLCVDECHRAGSPSNARALDGRFIATIGLSATPRRQYDSGFEEHVAPVLGDVVYEYSFEDALRDGVVSPFVLRNYKIPLTYSERGEYDRISRRIAAMFESNRSRSEGAFSLEALLRRRASVIVSARWRIPSAVVLAIQEKRQTIIFHERIAAAAEIDRLISGRGRRSVLYHSGLSIGMRQRNLELFREGIADTLVTCRSLDEGFNVPEAEIGVLAASTRSLRQRVQRLGRVIRRSPGKEMAVVCTLYATPVEEKQLQLESERLREVTAVEWFEAGTLA